MHGKHCTGAIRKSLAKGALTWSYRLYGTAGRLAPDGHPSRVYLRGNYEAMAPARETVLESLSSRAELAVYATISTLSLYILDILTPWFSIFPGVAGIEAVLGIGM